MRLATWNIEWFNTLFEDDALMRDARWSARRDVTRARQADAIAAVLRAMDPDALLVVEAPDERERGSTARRLTAFAAAYDLRLSRAMIGFDNGTQQEIALWFDPASLSARHDAIGARMDAAEARARDLTETPAPRFDSVLPLDLDEDGRVDLHRFSKPPLEAVVTPTGGAPFRIIGVHCKSKAPHGASSPAEAREISLINRRKQLAQCEWLRRRIDHHLDRGEDVIVLGDLNDGPGLDEYERLFGRSGVEIVMGDIATPDRLLRNPFVRVRLHAKFGWRPATARFYHRDKGRYINALLDFIMLTPDLAARTGPEWRIWHPFDDAQIYGDKPLREALLTASDHFPVTLDFAP